MLQLEDISGKQAKTLVDLIFNDANFNVQDYIDANNFKQIKDPKIILAYLMDVIAQQPMIKDTYNQNPQKAIKSVIGMMMANSGGRINPVIANEVALNFLEAK
jgi:aspartyl-tRNA(Asn)/glutamyl-tRNA(Gln) amidotransferase subunit B